MKGDSSSFRKHKHGNQAGRCVMARKTRGIRVRNRAYPDGGWWNDPVRLRSVVDDWLASDRPLPVLSGTAQSRWLDDQANHDLAPIYHTTPTGIRDMLQRCCSLNGKKGDKDKFKCGSYLARLLTVRSRLNPERVPTPRDWFLFRVFARGFNMAENPRRLNDEERATVLGLSVRTVRRMRQEIPDAIDPEKMRGLHE